MKLRQLQSDRCSEIPLAKATGALVSELLNKNLAADGLESGGIIPRAPQWLAENCLIRFEV